MRHRDVPAAVNDATADIVAAAVAVHRALGPGLYERVYRTCVGHELTKRGRIVEHEVQVPVVYDGLKFEQAYRLDLLVDRCVIVEVKAVSALADEHEAQLRTYLRLTGCKVGLLINFNVVHVRDGIRRLVNLC